MMLSLLDPTDMPPEGDGYSLFVWSGLFSHVPVPIYQPLKVWYNLVQRFSLALIGCHLGMGGGGGGGGRGGSTYRLFF